jgi:hypothetical protein
MTDTNLRRREPGNCPEQGREAVAMALEALPRMLVHPDGPFCLELGRDNPVPAFDADKSWRYTIMCLLGLARAEQAGFKTPVKLEVILERMLNTAANLGAGEFGLMLWMAVRVNSPLTTRIARGLARKLEECAFEKLTGMEVAWIMTGNAMFRKQAGKDGENSNRRLLDYFFSSRISESGLIYHLGRGWRRRFPNFATQIYSLHALSVCARLEEDARCAEEATRLGGLIRRRQRDNGGWPWLYDAKNGVVAEPFEVYSVHQHGMAPMAFFELAEATGCDISATLAKSMGWLVDRNELGFPMMDHKTGLIYRSIRRRKPDDRLEIYWRVMQCWLGLKPRGLFPQKPSRLEVYFTCRPYELGWTLEAWCGRR